MQNNCRTKHGWLVMTAVLIVGPETGCRSVAPLAKVDPAHCIRRCACEGGSALIDVHADPKAGNSFQVETAAQCLIANYDKQMRLEMSSLFGDSCELEDAGVPKLGDCQVLDQSDMFDAMMLACVRVGERQCAFTLLKETPVTFCCNQPIEFLLQWEWQDNGEPPLMPLFDAASSGGRGASAAFQALQRCCSQVVDTRGLSDSQWLKYAAAWYQSSWKELTLSGEYYSHVEVDPNRVPPVGLSRKE